MRTIRIGFMGFLVGFLLSMLLHQWVWLEMRVTIGAIIPWFVLGFALLGLWKKPRVSFGAAICIQGLMLLAFLLTYHFQWTALSVVPATLMKEALYLKTLSLSQSNLVLALVLAAGNAAWMASKWPRGQVRSEDMSVGALTEQ